MRDSNSRNLLQFDSLVNCCFKPLSQSSNVATDYSAISSAITQKSVVCADIGPTWHNRAFITLCTPL